MSQYDHPPPRGGNTQEKTRVGRWFAAFDTILGTTQAEMSRRIGYAKGSFSEATRGDGAMSRETFHRLLDGYFALAKEKGVELPATSPIFITIAWTWSSDGENYKDYEQLTVASAEQALKNMEWVASVVKEMRRLSQENDQFRAWKSRRDLIAHIDQLSQEREVLQQQLLRLRALLDGKAEDS